VTIASQVDGRTRAHDPDDAAWWRESAACRRADPELFFPISSVGRGAAEAQQAKSVCARCPVQPQCLAFALATGQEFGIWGGYDERELRLLQREGREGRAAESAGH
jgi:WhiB family redox-sensing transcriptional regulator